MKSIIALLLSYQVFKTATNMLIVAEQSRYKLFDMRTLMLADFAIVYDDETYTVLKNRSTGELSTYPIEDMPQEIADFMA